jgi:hypothetical protein
VLEVPEEAGGRGRQRGRPYQRLDMYEQFLFNKVFSKTTIWVFFRTSGL